MVLFNELPDDMILHTIQFLSLEEFNRLCQTNHMFYEDLFDRGLSFVLATHVISSPIKGNPIMSYEMQKRFVLICVFASR